MTTADFSRVFREFRRSAFRLETLQRYTVPGEAERLRAFQQTGRVDRDPETDPWLRQVREDTAAGKRYYRVHIVAQPLSDYLRFELASYAHNVTAGEEINIADRVAHPDLEQLHEDFWLFDDSTVVAMAYDVEGCWLDAYYAPAAALDDYRRRRDLALAHAVPLAEYLRRQERRGA